MLLVWRANEAVTLAFAVMKGRCLSHVESSDVSAAGAVVCLCVLLADVQARCCCLLCSNCNRCSARNYGLVQLTES